MDHDPPTASRIATGPSNGSPSAHRCAYVGLLLLGLALTGVAIIIFEAVAGTAAALIAGGCVLALFAVAWVVLPFALRTRNLHLPGRQSGE
ncbi:DUF6328 family protein [Mycobacterium bourgelatii]|uniref:DUF6328 family protein n=1 Tax=Mycobacterium bourgelatii TaxID=1273442 RepID=UPI0035313DBE